MRKICSENRDHYTPPPAPQAFEFPSRGGSVTREGKVKAIPVIRHELERNEKDATPSLSKTGSIVQSEAHPCCERLSQ